MSTLQRMKKLEGAFCLLRLLYKCHWTGTRNEAGTSLSWFRTGLRHSSIGCRGQFAGLHKHPPSQVVCFSELSLSFPANRVLSNIKTKGSPTRRIQLATSSNGARKSPPSFGNYLPELCFLYTSWFLSEWQLQSACCKTFPNLCNVPEHKPTVIVVVDQLRQVSKNSYSHNK